jgi:hypothetical protein
VLAGVVASFTSVDSCPNTHCSLYLCLRVRIISLATKSISVSQYVGNYNHLLPVFPYQLHGILSPMEVTAGCSSDSERL